MRPNIVCLCGSTRFYEAFMNANYRETMKGNIVLSVGFFLHRPDTTGDAYYMCTPEQKIELDRLHRRKIDLADETLVLNVDGYIGESTQNEIAYTIAMGKGLRFLETEKGEEYLEKKRHVLGSISASYVLDLDNHLPLTRSFGEV